MVITADLCQNVGAMLNMADRFESLLSVFHSGTRLTYNKGEYIIRPGVTPPGVFYIETGLIKAYDITKYGEENLLIIRKEREIFPIIWAVTGRPQELQVIYQAISPSTLWRISRRQFLDHIQNDPKSMASLLELVVEMYRIHSERILNLEYRTVRERLISFLLTMAARFGRKTNGGVLVDVPLRQQDIASSISASREATSRALSTLEKRALISNKSSLVTILDEAGLRAYLTFGGRRPGK